jgi:excisionase family DNA binding protein
MTDEVLTLEEAARFMKVDVGLVSRLLESKELPGRMLGDEWRTTTRAVVGFVDSIPSQMTCCTTEDGVCCMPAEAAVGNSCAPGDGCC